MGLTVSSRKPWVQHLASRAGPLLSTLVRCSHQLRAERDRPPWSERIGLSPAELQEETRNPAMSIRSARAIPIGAIPQAFRRRFV